MRLGPQQKVHARNLRRQQTDAETLLWSHLRNRGLAGVKFRRQHPIGPYIADFISVENKLVIEIDGGHNNQEATSTQDQIRTTWLNEQGYQVLRFWNNDVLANTEGVLERIAEAISPSP